MLRKFNFHWGEVPPPRSAVVMSFSNKCWSPPPQKKAKQKILTVCVQLETIIDFAVGEEKACIQAEWRERDMLAPRVIASQALIRVVVFYRYLVSNIMNVVDFHDLQKSKENKSICRKKLTDWQFRGVIMGFELFVGSLGSIKTWLDELHYARF